MSDLEDFDADGSDEPTDDQQTDRTDEPTGPRRLESVIGDDAETRHTVSESADKIVLKTEVKRGTGTRDQDKIDVKVKGNDPGPTVDKLARVLDSLESLDVADRLRETQPAEDDA